MKKLLLLILTLLFFKSFGQNRCAVKDALENDLLEDYTLVEYLTTSENVQSNFDAYQYLYNMDVSKSVRSDTELLKSLANDLDKSSYKLREQFDEFPEDVLIWKEIKENPFSAFEFIQETDNASWLRFKKSEFYKATFNKGILFNENMHPRIRGDLENFTDKLKTQLKDAVQINELHTLPKKSNGSYGKKVIMDNAFIKDVTDEFGVLEYYKVIYNDNKFGPNSPWTTNQKEEIIHFFRDNPDTEFIALEFRSQSYPTNSFNLEAGFEARLYREDVYKTLSDGIDTNPQFGEVINMNSNGFR